MRMTLYRIDRASFFVPGYDRLQWIVLIEYAVTLHKRRIS